MLTGRRPKLSRPLRCRLELPQQYVGPVVPTSPSLYRLNYQVSSPT